jgi:hypothetical protein
MVAATCAALTRFCRPFPCSGIGLSDRRFVERFVGMPPDRYIQRFIGRLSPESSEHPARCEQLLIELEQAPLYIESARAFRLVHILKGNLAVVN